MYCLPLSGTVRNALTDLLPAKGHQVPRGDGFNIKTVLQAGGLFH